MNIPVSLNIQIYETSNKAKTKYGILTRKPLSQVELDISHMGYCSFCLLQTRCKDFQKDRNKTVQFAIIMDYLITIKYVYHDMSECLYFNPISTYTTPKNFSLKLFSETFVTWKYR